MLSLTTRRPNEHYRQQSRDVQVDAPFAATATNTNAIIEPTTTHALSHTLIAAWNKGFDLFVNIAIYTGILLVLHCCDAYISWTTWTMSACTVALYLVVIIAYELYDIIHTTHVVIVPTDSALGSSSSEPLRHVYPPLSVRSICICMANIVLLSCASLPFQSYMPKHSSAFFNTWAVLWVPVAWMVWSEVIFYTLHRIAHHRWFYTWIHKTHHFYRYTRPIYCQYLTVWETLLVNIPSTTLFMCLYVPHRHIAMAMTAMFVYNNVTGHRHVEALYGRHALHHIKSTYNYGNSGIIDTWCGTEYTKM